MKSDQDNLNVLRAIYKKPKASQREMAKNLGFSLGKLNYCIIALKKKGFLKDITYCLLAPLNLHRFLIKYL